MTFALSSIYTCGSYNNTTEHSRNVAHLLRYYNLKIMETMDRSISKDHVAGFLPSGKPGLGQYSKDSLTSRATAEIAVNYVIKALGEKHTFKTPKHQGTVSTHKKKRICRYRYHIIKLTRSLYLDGPILIRHQVSSSQTDRLRYLTWANNRFYMLQSNAVSHRLESNLESVLNKLFNALAYSVLRTTMVIEVG